MTSRYLLGAALLCGGLLLSAAPAAAQPSNRTFINLSAGVGYGTNPFLATDNDNGSGYLRVSAYGAHEWQTERSSTGLSAFVENSTYFDEGGNKQIFDLNGRTSYQASETVSLFGNVGFSGDFGGQLGTRFVDIPPATPEVPDPNLPPPVTVVGPDLDALRGRQYRVGGLAGASVRLNERDALTISAGANHSFYTRNADDQNYTTYSLAGSYNRQLNERTSVGFTTSVQRSSYSHGNATTLINAQVTGSLRLAEAWDVSGGVGVVYSIENANGGDDSNLGLSFNGTACRTSEKGRFCGHVARSQRSSLNADVLTTTSAGIDYSYRIDRAQSLQFSASVVHYSGEEVLNEKRSSNYFVTSASYDRTINNRFSGGVTASLRKLSRFGPDPDTDASGSLFLKYRLGNLQ